MYTVTTKYSDKDFLYSDDKVQWQGLSIQWRQSAVTRTWYENERKGVYIPINALLGYMRTTN